MSARNKGQAKQERRAKRKARHVSGKKIQARTRTDKIKVAVCRGCDRRKLVVTPAQLCHRCIAPLIEQEQQRQQRARLSEALEDVWPGLVDVPDDEYVAPSKAEQLAAIDEL